MTTPKTFTLPESWGADPYDDHWSFFYETDSGKRDEYDFRVEITNAVPEDEQMAVIALLEAAPRLLAALVAVKDAGYLEGGYQPTIDLVDTAIAEATGKEAA